MGVTLDSLDHPSHLMPHSSVPHHHHSLWEGTVALWMKYRWWAIGTVVLVLIIVIIALSGKSGCSKNKKCVSKTSTICDSSEKCMSGDSTECQSGKHCTSSHDGATCTTPPACVQCTTPPACVKCTTPPAKKTNSPITKPACPIHPTMCKVGSEWNEHLGECVCLEGYEPSDMKNDKGCARPRKCPAGTYKMGVGNHECVPCPETLTTKEGAVSREECRLPCSANVEFVTIEGDRRYPVAGTRMCSEDGAVVIVIDPVVDNVYVPFPIESDAATIYNVPNIGSGYFRKVD